MNKYLLITAVLIPLFFNYAQAAQSGPVDPSSPQTWIFSSDSDEASESWLGVSIADVTADRLGALKLKEEKGAEVTMVDQDAPAGKAGLQEHDVILSMNGTPVESAAQLRRMIHETPPGRVITLGLSRNGQPITVKVQLGSRENEFSMFGPNSKSFEVHVPEVHVPEIHIPEIDIPSITMVMATASVRSGLTVENITPQLGEFFGVKNGNGVLVRNVEKGSRAEKAGLRAGDVIIKVNDQSVHDTSDFTHAVHTRNANSIKLVVMRDRKEQNLNLVLPERKDTGDLWNEESFDSDALLHAESALALNENELKDQVAKLRPEVELKEQQAESARKMAENARMMAEDIRKSVCEQARHLRQQTEKQQEEFRKQQEELRQQLDQLRQRLRERWTDL
jgi:serine protease Do